MKVFLDTIGCRLNQAEIEKYATQFAMNGHELVGSPAEADLVVVNTCTVTAQAGSDSRQKIRQAARAGQAQLVTTGCMATMDAQATSRLPHVVMNILNSEKDQLVSKVSMVYGWNYDAHVSKREAVPGPRKRTRAFIKAQDGCDNHCTYCITRLARGKSRSMPAKDVIEDIQNASNSGVKEVVLSGVQLGGWGKDLIPESNLGDLARIILKNTDIPRLRLSSVEPWDLGDRFFEIWRDPRVCRQLHLPMQSGSDSILKRMGRKNTAQSYGELVAEARRVSPDIALTTDLLVGFPGESEDDFRQTLQFVEEMKFAGGHVFIFSPRPGTPAEDLPDQVDWNVKRERSKKLRLLLDDLKIKYEQQFLGQGVSVLWENASLMEDGRWNLSGWTDHYIKCSLFSDKDLTNQISNVRLDKLVKNSIFVSEEL